jgi:hypothetical protein
MSLSHKRGFLSCQASSRLFRHLAGSDFFRQIRRIHDVWDAEHVQQLAASR